MNLFFVIFKMILTKYCRTAGAPSFKVFFQLFKLFRSSSGKITNGNFSAFNSCGLLLMLPNSLQALLDEIASVACLLTHLLALEESVDQLVGLATLFTIVLLSFTWKFKWVRLNEYFYKKNNINFFLIPIFMQMNWNTVNFNWKKRKLQSGSVHIIFEKKYFITLSVGMTRRRWMSSWGGSCRSASRCSA